MHCNLPRYVPKVSRISHQHLDKTKSLSNQFSLMEHLNFLARFLAVANFSITFFSSFWALFVSIMAKLAFLHKSTISLITTCFMSLNPGPLAEN